MYVLRVACVQVAYIDLVLEFVSIVFIIIIIIFTFVLCNTHVLNNKNNPIVWCNKFKSKFFILIFVLFFFKWNKNLH